MGPISMAVRAHHFALLDLQLDHFNRGGAGGVRKTELLLPPNMIEVHHPVWVSLPAVSTRASLRFSKNFADHRPPLNVPLFRLLEVVVAVLLVVPSDVDSLTFLAMQLMPILLHSILVKQGQRLALTATRALLHVLDGRLRTISSQP